MKYPVCAVSIFKKLNDPLNVKISAYEHVCINHRVQLVVNVHISLNWEESITSLEKDWSIQNGFFIFWKTIIVQFNFIRSFLIFRVYLIFWVTFDYHEFRSFIMWYLGGTTTYLSCSCFQFLWIRWELMIIIRLEFFHEFHVKLAFFPVDIKFQVALTVNLCAIRCMNIMSRVFHLRALRTP